MTYNGSSKKYIFPMDYKQNAIVIIGVLLCCIASIIAVVMYKNKTQTDWTKTQSYSLDLQVNMDTSQSGDETEVKRKENIAALDKHSLKRELDALFDTAMRNDVVLDSSGMVTMKIRHVSDKRKNGQLRLLLTSDDLMDVRTINVNYQMYTTFKYSSSYTVSEFVVV
jgi:hypothetical protein